MVLTFEDPVYNLSRVGFGITQVQTPEMFKLLFWSVLVASHAAFSLASIVKRDPVLWSSECPTLPGEVSPPAGTNGPTVECGRISRVFHGKATLHMC
jgi:hypothetical protein